MITTCLENKFFILWVPCFHYIDIFPTYAIHTNLICPLSGSILLWLWMIQDGEWNLFDSLSETKLIIEKSGIWTTDSSGDVSSMTKYFYSAL